MESTNCWLGLTIIKGSHLDVWQTNVQLQVIHLQIWIPGLPSWRHCLASATRAWSTPIHSSIPGHCKCSRFIKHFVDSVCADRFHCSRGPTFRSSDCKGFKRLGYYSCGQSNTTILVVLQGEFSGPNRPQIWIQWVEIHQKAHLWTYSHDVFGPPKFWAR